MIPSAAWNAPGASQQEELEILQENKGHGVEVWVLGLQHLNVPLGYNPCEGALENPKSDRIIYDVV